MRLQEVVETSLQVAQTVGLPFLLGGFQDLVSVVRFSEYPGIQVSFHSRQLESLGIFKLHGSHHQEGKSSCCVTSHAIYLCDFFGTWNTRVNIITDCNKILQYRANIQGSASSKNRSEG